MITIGEMTSSVSKKPGTRVLSLKTLKNPNPIINWMIKPMVTYRINDRRRESRPTTSELLGSGA
jgi:hypothetical protein